MPVHPPLVGLSPAPLVSVSFPPPVFPAPHSADPPVRSPASEGQTLDRRHSQTEIELTLTQPEQQPTDTVNGMSGAENRGINHLGSSGKSCHLKYTH